MAAKGAIGIEYRKTKRRKKQYYLIAKDSSKLSNDEQAIYNKLFKSVKDEITKEREVSFSGRPYLSAAMQTLESYTTSTPSASSLYKDNSNYKFISLVGNISIFIIFGGIVACFPNDETASLAVVLLALITLHQIFRKLIGAQTEFGAKTEAELAGLRMYLSTAEKHWLNQLTPPEKTPEHFEEMLPYAIALDVENQWCEKFHDVLKKYNYNPEWYANNNISGDFVKQFVASSAVASLGKSISSSGPSRISSWASSVSSGSSSWSSGSSGGGRGR